MPGKKSRDSVWWQKQKQGAGTPERNFQTKWLPEKVITHSLTRPPRTAPTAEDTSNCSICHTCMFKAFYRESKSVQKNWSESSFHIEWHPQTTTNESEDPCTRDEQKRRTPCQDCESVYIGETGTLYFVEEDSSETQIHCMQWRQEIGRTAWQYMHGTRGTEWSGMEQKSWSGRTTVGREESSKQSGSERLPITLIYHVWLPHM